jgi:FG-GAP-like repeat
MCFCYSLREMNVRWLTSKAAFLLLALLVLGANRLPPGIHAETPNRSAVSRFTQSIALSDFDADGLIDEARLDGSSLHRSVGILLSGTGKRSFLHFNANRANYGSLFAQDIDNDGATDLIWTDPLDANNVVVWLGNGSGQFERVDPGEYGGGFALGETEVAQPDDSNQETAINFETNRPLDQAFSQKCLDQSASELPNDYPDRLATSSPALGQPTGRAPPLLHC